MTTFLGIGSNLGDRAAWLRAGIAGLRAAGLTPVAESSVWETAPVDAPEGVDAQAFLNMVVGCETGTGPAAVNDQIERIHALAGRIRGEARFADRPLDIDLLLYDDLVIDEPGMQLPRTDVLDYNFVLRPLAEIAPGVKHPLTGKTLAEHWREFDDMEQPLERVELEL